MSDKPMWRTAVEVMDGIVEPHLLKAAEHDGFATVTGVVYHVRRSLSVEVDRLSGALLHTLNLPTRSDVNRVLRQVASLQREVRDLHDQLESPGTRSEARDATSSP